MFHQSAQPRADIADVRIMHGTSESTGRAGWDFAERRKGNTGARRTPPLMLCASLLELLPRRSVVKRDCGRMSRFQRLALDQELLAMVLTGFQLVTYDA